MKILITGSKGLVGSSLNRVFENTSYEVFPATRENANLFSYEETKQLLEKTQPDIIINAAAKVGGIHANNTQRTNFILENLKINMNLLEASVEYPKLKLINLGSSCIYPLNASNPISEDSLMEGKLEPTNSPYAMAKLTAIEIGRAIKLEHGINVINLMPTNLYGPNDNFSEMGSHVIPGLIYRMHNAKLKSEATFKLWGSGTPKREFLHVDDLAEAISFILKNDIQDDLLNIGSGEEISILELVYLIKDVIKFEGEIIFDKTKPDGNPRKLLDSNKIKSYGWSNKIKLEEGLNSVYEWFKKNS